MWTIATVCVVVGQCKFLATCVLAGLFWFFFPMATVVMNDVSAYFCGISFGKKFIKAPFLSLSPNKTWEGFLGGAFLTFIFSFFFPALLAQYSWFTCPAQELSFIPQAIPSLQCEPNPVFLLKEYELHLPPSLSSSPLVISLYPVQLHGVAYGLFASFIAPFGGYMASAIKRAYGIKDFESFFPGHGGMMDRMDCQLLMLSFTWVHLFTFILPKIPTIKNVLRSISLMPLEEQHELFRQFGEQLQAIGN
jgi:phosphatidate cytidylyltransferase